MEISRRLFMLIGLILVQTVASFRPTQPELAMHMSKVKRSRKSFFHTSSSIGSPSGLSGLTRWMTENEAGGERNNPLGLSFALLGIVAQPVVWTSLYFVKTTGAGLPSGPFGLLGALEGISYLVMLGFVGVSLYRKVTTGSGMPPGKFGLLGASEGLSYLSLLTGILVLVSLVVDQGCVPNAKPILDYSEYLPVCESTPGLFGE